MIKGLLHALRIRKDWQTVTLQFIRRHKMFAKIEKYSSVIHRADVMFWLYVTHSKFNVNDTSKLTNQQWKEVYSELAIADQADSQLDELIWRIENMSTKAAA